ncbi:MAG: hypothetical protein ACOYNZ_08490 [Rhodoferax sp.]
MGGTATPCRPDQRNAQHSPPQTLTQQKDTSMKTDTRLERDPRYVAAKAKLHELTQELLSLERQRDEADAGLSQTPNTHVDKIQREASALLSGTAAHATMERESLSRTLNELTHRLAVVRQAVPMQRQIIDTLRAEIGKQIATELLPTHRANVKAVIEAALKLNQAVEAEAALRDSLLQGAIPFAGIIRAMPINGFLLRDNQGRLTRYLLECEAEGFCDASDLPDVVRAQIVPKAKPTPATVTRRPKADAADWTAP